MEAELEPGWLARQMKETMAQCRDWPDVLKPLRSLNAELIKPPMDQRTRKDAEQCH